jgi:hypothetical protein
MTQTEGDVSGKRAVPEGARLAASVPGQRFLTVSVQYRLPVYQPTLIAAGRWVGYPEEERNLLAIFPSVGER